MRTRLDWVNQVLSNCRLDQYTSLEEMAKSEFGRKAIHAYDLSKEWSLSMYPWPFAMRRERLVRAQEVPLTTWSFYYHFPNNYGHAWDIYAEEPNFQFNNFTELSVYSGFFDQRGDSLATMEGEYIGSDLEQLTMLYTRTDVDEALFSPHFASVVEKEASLRFALQTNMDASQFSTLQKFFR